MFCFLFILLVFSSNLAFLNDRSVTADCDVLSYNNDELFLGKDGSIIEIKKNIDLTIVR